MTEGVATHGASCRARRRKLDLAVSELEGNMRAAPPGSRMAVGRDRLQEERKNDSSALLACVCSPLAAGRSRKDDWRAGSRRVWAAPNHMARRSADLCCWYRAGRVTADVAVSRFRSGAGQSPAFTWLTARGFRGPRIGNRIDGQWISHRMEGPAPGFRLNYARRRRTRRMAGRSYRWMTACAIPCREAHLRRQVDLFCAPPSGTRGFLAYRVSNSWRKRQLIGTGAERRPIKHFKRPVGTGRQFDPSNSPAALSISRPTGRAQRFHPRARGGENTDIPHPTALTMAGGFVA